MPPATIRLRVGSCASQNSCQEALLQSEPTPLSPFGDMVAISEVFASSLDNFQPRHYSNVCCVSASGGKANIT